MPRVSIITALYNHEKFIGQAIESVLAQTYRDWELLIWDDGSSDGGLAIARSFAEKHPGRIQYFSHPGGANRGQENTRNAALERASGEYFCLLDSDDYYLPRKLELLVPGLADPKVGLTYGSALFYSDSSKETYPSGVTNEATGRVFEALIQDNFLCAGATLFRRQCLERGLRFDPEFRTIGEYPLWLKIARDWEFARVREPVAVWRKHSANLGTRLAIKGKSELVALCSRLAEDPEYGDYRESILRALAKRRYDYAAELYNGLKLDAAGALCRKVISDRHGTSQLRAKAAVLAGLSALGPAPNRYLARLKRRVWELRHPHAQR